MEERRVGTLEYLASAGIFAVHGFTNRSGGVSQGPLASLNLGVGRGDDPANVLENYRRLGLALGFHPKRTVLAHQVHGAAAHLCTQADWGAGLYTPNPFEADILLSNTPGTTLVVFGADCHTLLLFDPVHTACAAVHAGWRGTALKAPKTAVEEMTAHFGTDPAELRVAIGPGIGKCCFETDGDVPEALLDAFGDAANPFFAQKGDKFHVDLLSFNRLALLEAGVLAEHIDAAEVCTLCHPDKYWSNRHAQAHTDGRRGVQGGVICVP